MSIVVYRRQEYPVVAVKYYERIDPGKVLFNGLVSSRTLNKVLYRDLQNKNSMVKAWAEETDKRIAFFIEDDYLKNLDKDDIQEALNLTFDDFVFLEVIK
jgi:hypothetical protein